MRALVYITVVACGLLAACGDNTKARGDAGGDGGVDAPSQLGHCLDDRAAFVLPPNGQLPCDLLPPGFVAQGGGQ